MISFKNKIIRKDGMKVTNCICEFLEIVPQIWKHVQLYMKPQQ